jgi:hypothetical protein
MTRLLPCLTLSEDNLWSPRGHKDWAKTAIIDLDAE